MALSKRASRDQRWGRNNIKNVKRSKNTSRRPSKERTGEAIAKRLKVGDLQKVRG